MAFTPEAMDSYLPRVEATCRQYLERWAAQDCIDVQEEVGRSVMSPLLCMHGICAVQVTGAQGCRSSGAYKKLLTGAVGLV